MAEKENEKQEQNIDEQAVEENIYISKESNHEIEKAPKKRWYVVHT